MKVMANFISRLSASYNWLKRKRVRRPWPEGEAGLKKRDHRRMVGARWDELGPLQFNFMTEVAGLKPDDIFLEISCGSFRAGRFFIQYLNEGNYLGIDKQEVLVREGKQHEIPAHIWNDKKPEIVISGEFDFNKFSKTPGLSLEQSLFTHLTPRDIIKCLRKLSQYVSSCHRFYATFNETDTPPYYILPSHSSRFDYSFKQIATWGKRYGWDCTYIGSWGHPLDQKMIMFERKDEH